MKWVVCCTNAACERCGHEVTLGHFRMKWDFSRGKLLPYAEDDAMICPECGEVRTWKECAGKVSVFESNVFAGLDDDEKKRILRQRFDAGQRHGGREEMEVNKKQAIEKMIGYDK